MRLKRGVNYGILSKKSFKLLLERNLEFRFLTCRGKVGEVSAYHPLARALQGWFKLVTLSLYTGKKIQIEEC